MKKIKFKSTHKRFYESYATALLRSIKVSKTDQTVPGYFEVTGHNADFKASVVFILTGAYAEVSYTYYDLKLHSNGYGLVSCSDLQRMDKLIVRPAGGCSYSEGALIPNEAAVQGLKEFLESPFTPPCNVNWVDYDLKPEY